MLVENFYAQWMQCRVHQPECVVQPCTCGQFPAPLVVIAACRLRSCSDCYIQAWQVLLDSWSTDASLPRFPPNFLLTQRQRTRSQGSRPNLPSA
jgi:hypothetical protein